MKKKRMMAAALGALFLSVASGCGSGGNENLTQGLSLVEQLNYEEALNCFDAALLNKEDAQQAYRGMGLAYMGMSQYDKAAESLERALTYSDSKLDQIDYDINYYLATAYYKQGELDKARNVYEAIVDMRPKEKTAYYLKGVVELEQGNTDAAKADFDKAVEIDAQDYDMRINIFCSCAENGQQELGQEYLQAVLDGEDENLSSYNRGRMYYYLGDYENARSNLETAKDEDATADCVRLLGQTYEQLGDYNYAASVYSNYLNETPDAQMYNQLGLCELRIGNYDTALEAFQSGIAIEENQIMQILKFNEIVAYEYLGEFDQATILMESYLATYPDDEKAQREYEFLQTR
jgi:tetratricopeptide (TPR) repeat protein